ncbi:MAG TPA: glutathione peroxidase [Gemmataceae bacterium]|nr:glutathione peroxidase [Gemmataceae bacterium]
MRTLVGLVMGMLLLSPVLVGAAGKNKGDKKVAPALNFKMKGLDGKEVDLSKFQGKVVLIVNVASKCGNTPQYKGLEELYEKYGKEGLVVLGVPANNFGKQEPGTNEEIAQFCSSKYHVTFPMLAKVSVKGEDKCPLYKYLTSKETNPKFGGEVPWNFEKFLIGRNGEVVDRFKHRTKPESEEVVKSIEGELKKK